MRAFLNDEKGATSIEFGMIAGAMAVALIVSMPFLVNGISDKYKTIYNSLTQNFN